MIKPVSGDMVEVSEAIVHANLPEPPLPNHPEPHTMQWTALELSVIKMYGDARAAHAVEVYKHSL